MTFHAIVSLLAILLNFYILYPRASHLFKKKKEYFLIFFVTIINLVKCILPAEVSIQFLIMVTKNPNLLSTRHNISRLDCVGDFRAAILTTVYFFHGFVMVWIAIERLHTVKNPLKNPTTLFFHSWVLLIFAILSSGLYSFCYIDSVIHDPEKGSETCAVANTLGSRLLYPIMAFRVSSILIVIGIYPFLIFELRNLWKICSQQKFEVHTQGKIYKITVTICEFNFPISINSNFHFRYFPGSRSYSRINTRHYYSLQTRTI